jgi:cytochrome c-type biogenesis protein CcmH/NrfG
MNREHFNIRPLVLALLLLPGAAFAAADTNSSGAPVDPVLERAAQASDRNDWVAAQAILRDAVAKNPGNAEYHNMYAYNLRKGPNPDMSLVFKHYNEALRIEPKHRGANEYLGEAYLMVNNLPKAKEQLGVLDRLCFFPCKEFSDLKKSIAEYEAKGK